MAWTSRERERCRQRTRRQRLARSPLLHLRFSAVRDSALQFGQKRYEVLARTELVPVPRGLLLVWERGCPAAPAAASSHACSIVNAAVSGMSHLEARDDRHRATAEASARAS